MVEYNEYDVFYDYEVLQNVTTNAMLFPGSRKIVIPYNVFVDSIQPDMTHLNVTQADEDWILEYVLKENASSLKRWNIPVENVRMERNFMKEIIKLDTEIPQNGGTMFGFNSSGYDVAISAFLLDQAKQLNFSNVLADDMKVDAYSVREFSDYLINHVKRSPWASVRDRANEGRNFELFQKFASLMNSPWNIDVQSLNAKMSMTALKRLAAQGGFKIETSSKLSDSASIIHTIEDLAELISYNVNDIFATLWLFEQRAYQTPYTQRKTLIQRYGDNQFVGKNIKRDSTEAKLIENVISPNDKLVDDPVVSLAYPVVRGYMPESEKGTEFTLKKAQTLHKALRQATKALSPKEFEEDVDRAMNKFLAQQYMEFRDKDPEHMVVKHFYFPTGHPRIVSQNGTFVYAADDYDGFNQYMTHMMDFWAEANHLSTSIIGKGGLTGTMNKKATTDLTWDEHANKIIKHIGEHPESTLYKWLFYKSGIVKIVAKDKRLMMDLLNYVDENYDIHPDIYQYYSAFRGEDMGEQDGSANVKAGLPARMRTGAAVLVKPDVPVYVTMSIGGVHGNLIDLYQHNIDKEIADTYNDGRQLIMDFYTEKAMQYDPTIYLELTGETSEKEQEKIYALAGQSPEELAPVLARRSKRNGFVLGETQEIVNLKPHEYTSGTYAKAKFKKGKGTRELKTYTTTLYDTDVVHTDISSYYPTLIAILKTLQTESGQDLYNELRLERLLLKNRIPSDKATWVEQDHIDEAIQLANKLLLNAASGAADAGYDNNIRVNNKAYRMRIAGQLILFALTLDLTEAGAIPNSINTDGVYVHNIDEETADGYIQKWAGLYGLEADTEKVDLFISKDSNNRIEYYNTERGETILASGGTVGNWTGTTLTGNLNRPPIVDRALTRYLVDRDNPLLEFDRDYVRQYITRFIEEKRELGESDKSAHEELFNFFQLPLASNKSKKRFIAYQDEDDNWSYPSPINRVFLAVADESENYKKCRAVMIVINKTIKKDDDAAKAIAYQSGLVELSDFEDDKDVHIGSAKISGVSLDQHFIIQNQSTAEISWDLIDNLDIEAYVDIVEGQWSNWAV